VTDRRAIDEQRPVEDGRPGGTTPWRGSITELGTQMDSYYGRAIVKEPVWEPQIPFYLWTGGIAGAASVLHGLARVSGNHELARRALLVGAIADTASPLLLVMDLGRPERFLHMLRMFKVTSPMSVGSWILLFSGGASNTAAVLELLDPLPLVHRLRPVKWAAELVSFLAGPPLATYTGALLANTAIPVWSEARDELPWLFGASGAASAGAALAAATSTRHAAPARRAAIGGSAASLALTFAMERKLGFVGEVYKQGDAHRYGRIAKAATTAGAGLLALGGRRSRTAAAVGGALVLGGELALRWSVFKAGFQSARDPKYTVIPQKQRVAERGGGPST
jgi:formate-dependent nitrite reductase membrane component NrfD